jgi:hypothetical protein
MAFAKENMPVVCGVFQVVTLKVASRLKPVPYGRLKKRPV